MGGNGFVFEGSKITNIHIGALDYLTKHTLSISDVKSANALYLCYHKLSDSLLGDQ